MKNKLPIFRELKGESQEDFIKNSGLRLDRPTLSKIESGKVNPNRADMEKICTYIGKPADEIYSPGELDYSSLCRNGQGDRAQSDRHRKDSYRLCARIPRWAWFRLINLLPDWYRHTEMFSGPHETMNDFMVAMVDHLYYDLNKKKAAAKCDDPHTHTDSIKKGA